MAVRELVHVRGLEKTTPAFRRELIRVAERLDANPDYLAAVISFETAGSFDPAQPNLGGGSAIGLIQFMPATAKRLGTSRAELANMTGVQQLVFVEKYFAPARGRLKTLSDHYLAVFAPVGVGRPPGHVLPYTGKQYQANKALDRDGSGTITVGEAALPAAGIYAAGLKRPRIRVEMDVAEPRPRREVVEVLTPIIVRATRVRRFRRFLAVAAIALIAYAGSLLAASRRRDATKDE